MILREYVDRPLKSLELPIPPNNVLVVNHPVAGFICLTDTHGRNASVDVINLPDNRTPPNGRASSRNWDSLR